MKNFTNNDDSFIVTSDYYMSETAQKSDLVLPCASLEEKETITSNNNKEIHFSKQQKVPYAKSMSELWQICELSKYLTLLDVWNLKKVDENTVLINVIGQLKDYHYEIRDTLFNVLFINQRAKKHKPPRNTLNSEAFGDHREIISKNEILFFGYKYHLQKALYTEMSQFFTGVGYDLPNFEKIIKRDMKWPHLFNTTVNYRFNPYDDYYAKYASKKNDNYIFYGTLGGKTISYGNLTGVTKENKHELKYRAKLFTCEDLSKIQKPQNKFYLNQIKVLEHVNSGTITRNNPILNETLNQSYCYMNKNDMEKLTIQNNQIIKLSNQNTSVIIRAVYNPRFELASNEIAIANFGKNISLNDLVTTLTNTYVSIEPWSNSNV